MRADLIARSTPLSDSNLPTKDVKERVHILFKTRTKEEVDKWQKSTS